MHERLFPRSAAFAVLLVFFVSGCGKDEKPTQPRLAPPRWEVTGLAAGTAKALAVNNTGTVFASVEGDGIYKTTDNGATWSKPMSGPFQNGSGSGYAQCLAVDGHTLWAGTEAAGIHRSTDEGATWEEVPAHSVPPGPVLALGAARGTMFCGAENGIFALTQDDKWSQLDSRSAYAILGDSQSNGVHAGGGYDSGNGLGPAAILWSLDGGSGWHMSAVGRGRYVSALAQAPNGIRYAGVMWGGMLRQNRDDPWWSWEPISAGLEMAPIQAIAIAPTNHVFISTGGIYRSTDNGSSWERCGETHSRNQFHALAVNSGGYLFAGTEAGVLRARY